MDILDQSKHLREQFCRALQRDGATPSPDREPLLTEYRLFFSTIEKMTLTAAEIQAVSDLNTRCVDALIELAEIPTDIDLSSKNLCSAVLDWNLRHVEKISVDTLVDTYRLQAHIGFTFLGEALSTVLANLEEAVVIAYSDPTLAFSTLGKVFKLRSRILLKMNRPLAAETEAREAEYLFQLEKDYQELISAKRRL